MEAKKNRMNFATMVALGVVLVAAIGLGAQAILGGVANAQPYPNGQTAGNTQTQSKQAPGNMTTNSTTGQVKPMPPK